MLEPQLAGGARVGAAQSQHLAIARSDGSASNVLFVAPISSFGADSIAGSDDCLVAHGTPIAIIPISTLASPTHWIGLSRSPRNATATTIVTAGPNDEARPTSHVSATSRP